MIPANIVLALGLLQHGGIPANPSAEAFVRDLYQREAHLTRPDEEAFAGHKGGEAIYSPSLLSLMRRDKRNTPKGDVGKLDYDPICGCQDSDRLILEAIRIVSTDSSHVKAIVTLFPGANQQQLTLKLVLSPQGWRVDDVEGPKGFLALRALLTSKD
jgi:hypothetical protein